MLIDSKMADSNPAPGKEGTGLNLKNEADFRSVKSPRPAPSVKRGPALGSSLEVTYLLFRINFCSAWICLLTYAINATIDFRTSAFVTVAVEPLIEYLTVLAVSFVRPAIPAVNW